MRALKAAIRDWRAISLSERIATHAAVPAIITKAQFDQIGGQNESCQSAGCLRMEMLFGPSIASGVAGTVGVGNRGELENLFGGFADLRCCSFLGVGDPLDGFWLAPFAPLRSKAQAIRIGRNNGFNRIFRTRRIQR